MTSETAVAHTLDKPEALEKPVPATAEMPKEHIEKQPPREHSKEHRGPRPHGGRGDARDRPEGREGWRRQGEGAGHPRPVPKDGDKEKPQSGHGKRVDRGTERPRHAGRGAGGDRAGAALLGKVGN